MVKCNLEKQNNSSRDLVGQAKVGFTVKLRARLTGIYPIDISENECRDVAMQRLYKGFR
jgi:hypothetical protein